MPPYTAAGATTCAPASVNVQNTALIAAIPEANGLGGGRPGQPVRLQRGHRGGEASAVGLSIRL